QQDHELYKKQLEELRKQQKKCLDGISHQRYRMKSIQENLKTKNVTNPQDKASLKELKLNATNRKSQFREMEEILPHKNGLYLSIILGSVNVSLLNKADKYAYKHDYETFKVTVSYITLLLATITLIVPYYRWLDAVLHFLLVWYYCTLTIRENILMVNGSRIKGWWVTHHFISTACAAITLIWPDGYTYQYFRGQYGFFSFYLSVLYVMQFFYQKGCLYRLRALGERHDMDITTEGFMSWMWKGISFLLPFLFAGYFFQLTVYNAFVLYQLTHAPEFTDLYHFCFQFFQLYNAYVLYQLTHTPECTEWQVTVLAIIHLILAVGNITTTFKVVYQKMTTEGVGLKAGAQSLVNKYRFTNGNSNSN
ncbi:hypothetical protein FSP39_000666, partial [Pinctada imbricata]